MENKYKVTYFPFKATGEPIRLLLSYGNKKFEDIRIPFEEWSKFKKDYPMGQLPVLEINDKMYNQSLAICRYLAKEFNLYGNNNIEALEIDAMVDNVNDYKSKLSYIHYVETDAQIKEKKFAEVEKEYIPSFLDKFEKIAAANGGYLAAKKLTFADFILIGQMDLLNMMSRKDIFEGRPNLTKVKNHVMALPQIKAWYEKAPKSEC